MVNQNVKLWCCRYEFEDNDAVAALATVARIQCDFCKAARACGSTATASAARSARSVGTWDARRVWSTVENSSVAARAAARASPAPASPAVGFCVDVCGDGGCFLVFAIGG